VPLKKHICQLCHRRLREQNGSLDPGEPDFSYEESFVRSWTGNEPDWDRGFVRCTYLSADTWSGVGGGDAHHEFTSVLASPPQSCPYAAEQSVSEHHTPQLLSKAVCKQCIKWRRGWGELEENEWASGLVLCSRPVASPLMPTAPRYQLIHCEPPEWCQHAEKHVSQRSVETGCP